MQDKLKQETVEWFRAVIIALLIVVISKLFLFDVLAIDGASMEPTLHNQERIFLNIIGYKFDIPKQYDIIVFTPSIDKNSYYIKRVIGLPGDTVKVSKGKVYVNDTLLEEKYLSKNTLTKGDVDPLVIKVPESCVFVMGDNRNHSEDSRDPLLGPIPIKSIKGRAVLRILPLNKINNL